MAARIHDCEHCRHLIPDEVANLEQVQATLAGLGTLLEHVRTARGLSQRAAAKEIDVSFSTVSRIERGESAGDVAVAVKILAWIRGQAAGAA